MPISNGEQVNATVTNRAKMDREQDTDTVGKLALNNFTTDPNSGTDTTNVQRDINAIKNYIGQAANVAITNVPGFTNNTYGSVGDDVRERVDALAGQIQTNTADIVSVTSDVSDIRTLTGTVDGTTDLGTFTGVTIADNRNIKQALQDLETEVETRIDSTEKGAANGVATLDSGGKIPSSQLPLSVMDFLGNWNASTNSPSLADGAGSSGDTYRVSVAGTQDLGSGSISYDVGDWVYYTGSVWQRGDLVDAVTSVNSQTGAVTLTTTNISEGTNLYYTDARVLTKINATSIDALSDVDTTTTPPTDTQVLAWSSGSSKWLPANAANASGTGAINYLQSNPGAETNVTGYTAYADAAGTRPVDGTGGSPTVTVTRTTSSPLRGTGSILLTKDAANRQGEGFAYAFTIDSADQGNVVDITFDYAIASGTYDGGTSTADSDVIVYIYDVTNAVLIEPVPFKLDGTATSTFYKFKGSFQTSATSTSYRLIFHVATTSASAYTIKFDNFIVGPAQANTVGSLVSEWNTFTPTGSFTTNSTYTGRFRRVGDSIEVEARVSFSGAPNAATFTMNLPTGYVIDTNKITTTTASSQVFGAAQANNSATLNYVGVVGYNSTTSVVLVGDTGSAAQWSNTVPFSFSTSDSIELRYTVPISGFSATSVFGLDTDSRVVAMYATLSSQSHTSTGNWQDITSYTVVKDTHGMISSGVITVPVSGYYTITGCAVFSANATGIRSVRLNVNGSALGASDGTAGYSGDDNFCNISYLLNLKAGDTVKVQGFQNSGGNLAYSTNTRFNFEKISGTGVVAASEYVSARYSTTAGASIANTGTTRVNYSTSAWDSHQFVTTGASWVATVNKAGKWRIRAMNKFSSSTYAAGNKAEMLVFKNGSSDTLLDSDTIEVAASREVALSGEADFNLVAGDTLDIRLSNNRTAGATSLTTSASENYVIVTYEGY